MSERGTFILKVVTSFAAGALFTVGLVVSGMTQPEKVLGFLDVTGSWDASLIFVMIGAIGVHFTARRLFASVKKPVFAHSFHTFVSVKLDAPLIGGAALFGVGWGLSGYCPGPVIASSVVAGRPVLVFIAAMVAGMGAWEIFQRLRAMDTNAEVAAVPTAEPEGPDAS